MFTVDKSKEITLVQNEKKFSKYSQNDQKKANFQSTFQRMANTMVKINPPKRLNEDESLTSFDDWKNNLLSTSCKSSVTYTFNSFGMMPMASEELTLSLRIGETLSEINLITFTSI